MFPISSGLIRILRYSGIVLVLVVNMCVTIIKAFIHQLRISSLSFLFSLKVFCAFRCLHIIYTKKFNYIHLITNMKYFILKWMTNNNLSIGRSTHIKYKQKKKSYNIFCNLIIIFFFLHTSSKVLNISIKKGIIIKIKKKKKKKNILITNDNNIRQTLNATLFKLSNGILNIFYLTVNMYIVDIYFDRSPLSTIY
ncbi:hypothetical protein AGLY_013424 [Aphis glycines]|uniref:Uncharacterized protein n=1 Tax=Aphis glycines TaxID=307491 RepID=A0A6G0T6W5_APHGL|nr:hypothetical protein AGLY_013424 [Aphis glycines]